MRTLAHQHLRYYALVCYNISMNTDEKPRYISFRVTDELRRRLRQTLFDEDSDLQTKMVELVEHYVNGTTPTVEAAAERPSFSPPVAQFPSTRGDPSTAGDRPIYGFSKSQQAHKKG